MLRYELLNNYDLKSIYETFKEAFSDYVISMNPRFSLFESILVRRGFNGEYSIGAFDQEKLVGFILTSNRDWTEKKTFYTIGVGVIPSYRGQKIAEHLYHKLFDLGKEKGAEQYLLEVITTNLPAIKLYEKLGFTRQRTLRCFDLPNLQSSLPGAAITSLNGFMFRTYDKLPNIDESLFMDYDTSWQYSRDSITADSQGLRFFIAEINGEMMGYLIIDLNGTIFQLAVRSDYRRQGIAKGLLSNAQSTVGLQQLSISNIDARNQSLLAFLEAIGFQQAIDQYEMCRQD